MNGLRARELMTPDVVTIPPDLPVAAIARLLTRHGISAVPVVDADGVLLGIVTEADLIRRLASRLDRPPSWLTSLVVNPAVAADCYARTHGFVAQEVMTTHVVTVTLDTPIAEIAALIEQNGIRRVLVMEDGRLRGLVSRADLLRALVAPAVEAADVSDERIRRAVVAAMRREPWAYASHTVVEVRDGVVEFHGFSPSEAVQRGLRVLAEQVPGVKGVADRTQPLPPYLYEAM
ncbi:CBS domain-containing protein [Siccirubricoccus sp. G192]|uniref:CBS domain-containing protein n=1 Tax=Siccirubricoccus sp. G192 TaxID=2849651 RepID=UPI0020C3ACF9|nr:CBS domain-containing protein [Siccirubricoccus sp. G192]